MGVDNTFLLAVACMAAASFACRTVGFILMGWVPITPRVEAALRAMPLAVMVGIVTPAVTAGRLPEIVAVAVVVLVVRLTGRDVAAAVAGAATVGLMRWLVAAAG